MNRVIYLAIFVIAIAANGYAYEGEHAFNSFNSTSIKYGLDISNEGRELVSYDTGDQVEFRFKDTNDAWIVVDKKTGHAIFLPKNTGMVTYSAHIGNDYTSRKIFSRITGDVLVVYPSSK